MSESKFEEGIRTVDEFVEGTIDGASSKAAELEESFISDAEKNKQLPKPMKVFGVLLIIGSILHLLILVTFAVVVFYMLASGQLDVLKQAISARTNLSVAIMGVHALLSCVTSFFGFMLGLRILKNHREKVSKIANRLALLETLTLTVSFMIAGLSEVAVVSFVYIVFLVVLSVYADPRLHRERIAKRKAQALEDKADQEAGTLGLDKTGKGYIELDFFNLFWIFVVCSFLGLVLETIWHVVVVDPGVYQNRAGLLYGPFSPIYGIGGTLITIALNRFYKSNPLVVFLAAGVIGSAFEFFVSWWMETSFGIVAWNYSGTFLNIDGRTNFQFFCMWGALGIVWLRFILPRLLQLINLIPWNWRYTLTVVCATLMLANCVLTVSALDCWYLREAGLSKPEEATALEQFCNKHYDDKFMEDRFQSMTMNPNTATRLR